MSDPTRTKKLRTISENMADTSQHFVWVADEADHSEDYDMNDAWQAHCSCGWSGAMTRERSADTEAHEHVKESQ